MNKLMITKFPSSALLMELSAFLKKRKIKALVEWTPGESNKEADALANGVNVDYNPTLDVDKLRWCLLPEALEVGRQADEAFRKANEQGQLPNRAKKERRKAQLISTLEALAVLTALKRSRLCMSCQSFVMIVFGRPQSLSNVSTYFRRALHSLCYASKLLCCAASTFFFASLQ